jgi:hypothetical protein
MMKKELSLADSNTKWWSNALITDGWKGKVSLAVLPGVFVALFLNVFQPFTVNNADGSWRFAIAIAGYGLLSSLIILCTEFVIRPLCISLFQFKHKSMWSDGAWYIWHFVTVGIGMMLYREYLCYEYFTWPPLPVVFSMFYRTCMIGLIPMILLLVGQKVQRLSTYVNHLDTRNWPILSQLILYMALR